jgi:ABC-type multidrug transport system fused ATPase/permease subunit
MLIDGVDLKRRRIADVRRAVGIVQQDTVLLTIRSSTTSICATEGDKEAA